MGNAGAGLRQTAQLLPVEMDAVGEPGAIGQPAAVLDIVDRRAAEAFAALGDLVARLRKMRVQAALAALGELRRLDQQLARHVERRARRERQERGEREGEPRRARSFRYRLRVRRA